MTPPTIKQTSAPAGKESSIWRGISTASQPIATYTPAVTQRGALMTNTFTTTPMSARAQMTPKTVLGFGAAVMRAIPYAEATALLTYALNHGITYFDTAPGYGDSEVKLGSLAPRRDEYVLATKIDLPFTR